MPAYITRWPDASFSITVARNLVAAAAQLDDIGDVNPIDVEPLVGCVLHVRLTPRGEFVVDLTLSGDDTVESIFALYPHLARSFEADDKVSDLETPAMAARWQAAVRQELADVPTRKNPRD